MTHAIKEFKSYAQQVDLLETRGMEVGDRDEAALTLSKVSYYRLSGYWYPLRKQKVHERGRSDTFRDGTTLSDVLALYDFDARLRTTTFAAMTPIELAIRATLGHALGEVHESAHLRPELLGSAARQGKDYEKWIGKYHQERRNSHEDFVDHHDSKYGGTLPVWAAVELLGWGALAKLLEFSPRPVQDTVADTFNLTAPQLRRWMKSLNMVRNTCAHHGRLFNRVHALQPMLPRPGTFPGLDALAPVKTRTFTQLTLIQHMLHTREIGSPHLLPSVLRTYPNVPLVERAVLGASDGWNTNPLWT